MANINELVKIAVDGHRGSVQEYSVGQSQEVLRQALIEANGGSTKLDYRKLRDGQANGLFAIIEELLSATVIEGLQGDEFFNSLVDFRNVPAGDELKFDVLDGTDLFVVAEIADGTQGIRRQRLGGVKEVSIPASWKAVRIYEELSRVLSGRVDFNEMIDKVGLSFRRKLLDDIYALWNAATAQQFGGATYFPAAGAYDEEELLDLISHVEAAAGGRNATVIGTKKALRTLAPSIQGYSSKEDIYNMGYYGKFYGSDVVCIPQRHKVGSTAFVMDDNVISIIAGDEKPLKCVYEGSPLAILHDPTTNADLTNEFFYAEKYGVGIVVAGSNNGIGRYEFTV